MEVVVETLECIKQKGIQERRTAMLQILASLTDTNAYAGTTLAGVKLISDASQPCFEQCTKLLDLSLNESLYVAAVQLNLWLANADLDQSTTQALQCLATALRLPLTAKAQIAKDYFLRRVADLMKRAAELEAKKAQLKRIDKPAVTTLLLKLNIEDNTSAIDDEILSLRNDIINLVEQVDESTLELSFPLAHLKPLQRKAMDLAQNETLVVRVTKAHSGAWESFCVRTVDPQTDWSTIKLVP